MRSSWSVWVKCVLALVICIQLVCAAPADSHTSSVVTGTPTSALRTSSPHSSPSVTASSATHGPASDDSHDGDSDDASSATQPRLAGSTTSSHSLFIPLTASARPTLHSTWTHTGSRPFSHPFPPNSPTSPPRPPSRSQGRGQAPVAIVFEVIAGAAGLLIVFALGRCLYSYKRTPSRDRIGALLNRHRLEREMEEMERARMERLTRTLESHIWRPPPPPYQQAPPYETVVNTDSSIDWGRPTQPLSTHPPP